jgi:hypothetical protein
VDTSKELYSVFKTSDVHNDNKRIENSSNEYGYDMGGNYIHSDYDPMIEPKYDHHSHIPRCNDGDVYHTGPDGLYKIDEMNEYNKNWDVVSEQVVKPHDDEVSYDDDQNEESDEDESKEKTNDWRDKFAGWLP